MILLWFTAGVVPAVLLGVYLPWSAWVLPVGLGSLAAGFLFKGLKKWPPLRRFLFGAGAILVWLAVYSALVHAPAQDLEHRTIRMEAVVTQWPEETDYGVRVPVRAGEREGRKVSALFYGPADLADLRPGDRISCVARCTPAEELGGEESLYYPSQGILLRMKGYGQVMVTRGESSSVRYALTILAGEIRAMLDQLYPPREAGFLHALLTGDKTGLEETDRNNLNRVGLGHVVVVSGLHVTFLMGFLTLFLDPKKKGQLGLLLLILVLFCLMTGKASTRVSVMDGAQYKTRLQTRVKRRIDPDGTLFVSLRLTLTLSAGNQQRTEEEIAAEIAQDCVNVLQKLQAASCDAVGFGKIRIRAFPDIPAWERLNWPAQYETLPVRVTADVKILQ